MADPASGSLRTSFFFLGAIFILWLIVYVPGLFRPSLLDDADSVHAEAAKEILLRHDWVTLHANGIRYMEKAPLMYWYVAASFRLLGVAEWSARLPLALSVLALWLACFSLGRRAFGEEAGFYSALVAATSFGPYIFTRILIPDILVGLWLTLGFAFFLRGLEQERPSRLLCWGLAVTAALNVLTKGLIGLVFPALAIGLYLVLTRNLRYLRKMRLISSSLAFLVVAAPWHILAALRNPDQGPVKGFLWFYFVNEHFLRYLNKRVPHDYDTVPLLLFWALMLVWLLPWSAFLFPALAQIPWRLGTLRSRLDARGRANLLCGTWAGSILIFFSFSTRQEYYIVPALPALALLLGGWLGREGAADDQSSIRRAGRVFSAILFAVGTAAFAVTIFLFLSSAPAPANKDISELLSKNPQAYALSFGHVLDLTPQALGAFRAPLLAAGIALLLGTGLNWLFRRRRSPAKANAALAAMAVVLLYSSHAGLMVFEPVLSSKQLALAIEKAYRPGEFIVINGEYESGSTLNFYTGVQVHILNGRSADLWYGSLFPDAPQIFEDNASFARLWAGPARVYLWTENDRRGEALRGIDPASVYELAHSGGKVILSNR